MAADLPQADRQALPKLVGTWLSRVKLEIAEAGGSLAEATKDFSHYLEACHHVAGFLQEKAIGVLTSVAAASKAITNHLWKLLGLLRHLPAQYETYAGSQT